MFLNREQIFESVDYTTERVSVPEWRPKGQKGDAYVNVRGLTASQRAEFETVGAQVSQSNRGYDKIAEFALKAVVWCVVDEDGNRVFQAGDVKALGEKSSAPITRIYETVLRLSGLTNDAADEAAEDFDETQD